MYKVYENAGVYAERTFSRLQEAAEYYLSSKGAYKLLYLREPYQRKVIFQEVTGEHFFVSGDWLLLDYLVKESHRATWAPNSPVIYHNPGHPICPYSQTKLMQASYKMRELELYPHRRGVKPIVKKYPSHVVISGLDISTELFNPLKSEIKALESDGALVVKVGDVPYPYVYDRAKLLPKAVYDFISKIHREPMWMSLLRKFNDKHEKKDNEVI